MVLKVSKNEHNEMMKGCKFSQSYLLPTKKDLIRHYYYNRNTLMMKEKVYQKKRPLFNIDEKEVVSLISNLLRKSCLPTISKKINQNRT